MRCTALVYWIALGCYQAHAPAGAPCDPATPSCPSGQVCTTRADGSFCLEPGAGSAEDAALDTDAAIDAVVDGAMVDALTHVEVQAIVADCINPAAPDPDVCITQNGVGQLVIDATDSTTMQPWQAYIRFDLDATIAGRTVTAVSLRTVATSDVKAPGTNTGAVWQVAAFTRSSLFTTVPATMGAALAGSQGAVAIDAPVTWPLPTSLVAPNGSVYLGIISTSTDGVNYWNATGTTPPRLLIDLL